MHLILAGSLINLLRWLFLDFILNVKGSIAWTSVFNCAMVPGDSPEMILYLLTLPNYAALQIF